MADEFRMENAVLHGVERGTAWSGTRSSMEWNAVLHGVERGPAWSGTRYCMEWNAVKHGVERGTAWSGTRSSMEWNAVLHGVERGLCQQCADNTRFGPGGDMENGNLQGPGGLTNTAFVSKTEAIDCCGVLDRFEAYVRNSGTLYYHIWRPNSAGDYTIIGEWSQSCQSQSDCDYNVPNSEEITVMSGDLFGWWSSSEMIEYEIRLETFYTYQSTGLTNGSTASLSNSVNFREYAFRITVDDNRNPFFNDLANDGSTSTDVLETTAVSTSIWQVDPDDNDISDVTSLTVTMATNAYFSFDPSTNDVSVSSSLFTAPSPQVLSFTVVDQCGNTETRVLNVNIINFPPFIENLPNATSILEITETSTYLYTVNVTSSDVVTCIIDQVNPNSGDFNIIQAGGTSTYWDISTISGCYFDYGTAQAHVLTIKCSDTSGDSDEQTFTVNLIPNQPPVINNLANSTELHEDTDTESFLYRLDVTDADSLSVTCSLTATSTEFRVRQVTGSTDWGVYSLAGAAFDYNSVNYYDIGIECTDGRDADTGIYTVYLIRNDPPQLTNVPANVSLSTSAPIGYTVYELTSYDASGPGGRMDQLTYSISCNPSGCPFTILASGHLELDSSISDLSLVGYDVTVTVCDHRNCGINRILTVTIVDINDLPDITNLNQAFNVAENTDVGETVVKTACTDFDVPEDTLTLSMTCVPASGTSLFRIDSTTGEITVSAVINYETLTSTSFTCVVTCSDGQATDTATLNLDITDVNEAPTFTQNAYSIYADEGPGGTELQASPPQVNDQDSDEIQTFTLDCGNDTGYFYINGNTGLVSFATDYDVDPAGGRPTYVTCSLGVTDKGALTDTASLSITINNINDNTPVFLPASYAYFADWNAPTSTAALSPADPVSAVDGDLGDYGTLTYSLDQSSLGNQYFGITQSGTIFVVKSIQSLGYGGSATFNVIATDGGGLETRANVTVAVMATTTTSTTSTTDRFVTFFEDDGNLTWFPLAMVILLVVVVTVVYMVCTYWGRGGEATSRIACRCCKIERVPKEPKKSYNLSPRRDFPKELSNGTGLSSNRDLTINSTKSASPSTDLDPQPKKENRGAVKPLRFLHHPHSTKASHSQSNSPQHLRSTSQHSHSRSEKRSQSRSPQSRASQHSHSKSSHKLRSMSTHHSQYKSSTTLSSKSLARTSSTSALGRSRLRSFDNATRSPLYSQHFVVFSTPKEGSSQQNERDIFPLPTGEFQKRVLMLLSDIQHELAELKRQLVPNSQSVDSLEVDIWPAETLDDFHQLDDKCSNTQERKKTGIVQVLSKIGGVDAKDNVKKIMERLMSNRLIALFSMKGRSTKNGEPRKLGVQTSSVYEVVKASAFNTYMKEGLTDQHIYKYTGDTLKYVPDRHGGGGRKLTYIQ
ncbi:cadherin EGF LAG seven-pass G-type receptor 2-like [Mya arenaria]|uniref:cadherin EGF LAG seven-pass G-type receptor 2-like n=1 Tax=Mya arenaria TaxID=6604 RepID=UPI0022E908C7|nr:cadherin EGF LAG seven-pass G-type receptor 2-like [Mya arenaria]